MTDDIEIINWRKRLIFRSDHRGTKEMDIIMGSFAKKYVPDFDRDELAAYEELLQENDPNLYNWIIGKEAAPDHVPADMLHRIQAQYKQG